MMQGFQPDYRNIVDAAANRKARRVPLYEHLLSEVVMEKITGRQFMALSKGGTSDRREYLRQYCQFFCDMGYDTVSMERVAGEVMPGSGALGKNKDGVIKTRADFDNYPWAEIPRYYFEAYDEDFRLLREVMPVGMKAIGGVGNGVFECVQDVVGYIDLCFLSQDDPDLYRDIFTAAGDMLYTIWGEFMRRYGDIFCVCRFGDDLGFNTQTLLSEADIRAYIIPQYARIIDLVHRQGKPFLLHCCGKIFGIMEELIAVAKIDAKHSNEDQIAPFSQWVDLYGDRIGNFGGIDTDHLCSMPEDRLRALVAETMEYCKDRGGFALGSGNSIADYVDPGRYLAMVETARVARGE